MPYVTKASRRLTEVCLDLPNPPPELHSALDDMLVYMKHPLALSDKLRPTADMSIAEIKERFQTGAR